MSTYRVPPRIWSFNRINTLYTLAESPGATKKRVVFSVTALSVQERRWSIAGTNIEWSFCRASKLLNNRGLYFFPLGLDEFLS